MLSVCEQSDSGKWLSAVELTQMQTCGCGLKKRNSVVEHNSLFNRRKRIAFLSYARVSLGQVSNELTLFMCKILPQLLPTRATLENSRLAFFP